MSNNKMFLKPIGVIHSPFTRADGTPIQPSLAEGAEGMIEIFEEYVAGVQDLGGFERIWVLYWFDRAGEAKLRLLPFRDREERGLFATRAPCRPNPIGLSVVSLKEIKGVKLRIRDVDVLDGTPLLDIKPYVPAFDAFPESAAGWFDRKTVDRRRADARFDPKSQTEDVD